MRRAAPSRRRPEPGSRPWERRRRRGARGGGEPARATKTVGLASPPVIRGDRARLQPARNTQKGPALECPGSAPARLDGEAVGHVVHHEDALAVPAEDASSARSLAAEGGERDQILERKRCELGAV